MPLTETVSFKAVLRKGRRVQIPRVIRWRFKLDPGEVFEVTVRLVESYADESFYARMGVDGRITVPKLQAEILAERIEDETLESYAVDVTLSPLEDEGE